MTEPRPRPTEDLQARVLCIEDDPLSIELLRGLLARLPGVQLLQAASGREGIEMARAERPDLVVLDMHLPDIGGLDVVRTLSEDIAEHGLRIVILSADRLSMDIIKAMSLGAYEYWTKPVTLEVIESCLRRALAGKRGHPSRRLPQA